MDDFDKGNMKTISLSSSIEENSDLIVYFTKQIKHTSDFTHLLSIFKQLHFSIRQMAMPF